MSGLELNKIAAAVLLASLIAMVVGTVANILYKPKLQVAQRGYEVEVTEDAKSVGEEVVQLSLVELMAQANAQNGKKIAKKCVSCHTFDAGGAHKIGPNIHNIVGAPKASREGFAYSGALKALGGSWDDESLYAFLKKPSKYVPGTKMSFAGLRKPQDIADMIAYLKEGDS